MVSAVVTVQTGQRDDTATVAPVLQAANDGNEDER